MKLWHIAQWGNPKDGPDGWDTQCVVSAVDLPAAIEVGQVYLFNRNGHYRDGKADTIYLLGDDGRVDGNPELVIRPWLDPAMNLLHNPAWFRKYWEGDGNEWGTQQEIYGDE